MAAGYVVKLIYENMAAKPYWVSANDGGATCIGPRVNAVIYSTQGKADEEARKWKASATPGLSVVVERA